MNDIFRPVLNKFVLVYLDDILIFSKEHLDHLRQVLQILRDNSFYAKLSKCSFAQSEVECLGHILSRDGLRVDLRKTAAVQSWPTPDDLHQLRSFLGLANYFRKFISDYSSLTHPLTCLLRKDAPWTWSAACAAAFQSVKDALTSAPVLALPDFTQPFHLEVISDSSGFGLGAVLLQNGRPVAFESRQLTSAERNYATGEQELLAVVHAKHGAATWRGRRRSLLLLIMSQIPSLALSQLCLGGRLGGRSFCLGSISPELTSQAAQILLILSAVALTYVA